MSQVGQELVCDGAICRCDKGSAPSPLRVTSQHHAHLQGKLVLTSQDKTFLPFGSCQLQNNNPCTPAPLLWQDIFEVVEVGLPAQHPLLEKSTIKCSMGGKISVINTLQVSVPGPAPAGRAEELRTTFMNLCPLLLNEDAG